MACFLVFGLHEKKIALPVEIVSRVIHAAQVTEFPDSPNDVCGLINVGGKILPVITFEPKFKSEIKPIQIYDYFILVDDGSHCIGLKANRLFGTIIVDPVDLQPAHELLPGLENCVEGVLKVDDEIILVNPRKFLHLDDGELFSKIEEFSRKNDA